MKRYFFRMIVLFAIAAVTMTGCSAEDKTPSEAEMLLNTDQPAEKKVEYSEDDKAVIRELLEQGNNADVLGWDKDNLSSWWGVEWEVISGEKYIVTVDLSDCDVTGDLDVRGLKHLKRLYLRSTGITALNVSGLPDLEWLDCSYSEIERLDLSDLTDNMIYIDCMYNYLDVEDIEKFCLKVKGNEGFSEAFYKPQFINADVSEFNKNDLECLEMISDRQEIINWDMTKPGRIYGVKWVLKDGEYRAREINLSNYTDITGIIDLSGFDKLIGFSVSCTMVKEVRLPQGITEIPERAFYGCMELERIRIPDSVNIVGSEAFGNCPALKAIYFEGNSPMSIGVNIITPSSYIEPGQNFPTVYYKASTKGWDSRYWKDYKLVPMDDGDKAKKKTARS